jgi:riboflavin synthase
MFTGIIETTGIIRNIISQGSNLSFWVESNITSELKIDQSLAHNGVCLTVVDLKANQYCVTAVAETISKTNLAEWKVGTAINLERALKVGDRLDGHFVQGHVDSTGVCTSVKQLEGSWLFHFSFPKEFAALMIEKGSICINGVSLTAFNITNETFTVTIIPYTFEHTNFKALNAGDKVNFEFDVLGKYLLRKQEVA